MVNRALLYVHDLWNGTCPSHITIGKIGTTPPAGGADLIARFNALGLKCCLSSMGGMEIALGCSRRIASVCHLARLKY